MEEPSEPDRKGLVVRRWIPVAIVLILGLAITLTVYFVARRSEVQYVTETFTATGKAIEVNISTEIADAVGAIQSLKAFFNASAEVSRSEFDVFASNLLEVHPGICILQWLPVVPHSERAALVQQTQIERPGFEFKVYGEGGKPEIAPESDFYYPVYFIAPIDKYEAGLGLDFGADSARLKTLTKARDTGEPVIGAHIVLTILDSRLDTFTTTFPVYRPPADYDGVIERRSHLVGFASGIISVSLVVDHVIQKLDLTDIDVQVVDVTDPAEPNELYTVGGGDFSDCGQSSDRPGCFRRQIGVGDRKWAVTVMAIGGAYSTQPSLQSWTALIGGLITTILIAGAVYWQIKKSQHLIEARKRAEHAEWIKTQFFSNYSHELRTPIAGVIGYAEMLKEEADTLEPDQLKQDLTRIMASGQHLLSLVNNLLDAARMESGRVDLEIESIDLDDLLDEVSAVMAPLIQQKHNTFQLEKPHDLGQMATDSQKLRQILINLLGNATKFTEKGTITLHAEYGVSSSGREELIVRVSDTGLGMSNEQISQAFERFGRFRKGEGSSASSGLGLSLVQQFTSLLQGEVSIESELGKGTTFTVQIPRYIQV